MFGSPTKQLNLGSLSFDVDADRFRAGLFDLDLAIFTLKDVLKSKVSCCLDVKKSIQASIIIIRSEGRRSLAKELICLELLFFD